jgi:hypothetical protein
MSASLWRILDSLQKRLGNTSGMAYPLSGELVFFFEKDLK